jgi:hypothetical protein
VAEWSKATVLRYGTRLTAVSEFKSLPCPSTFFETASIGDNRRTARRHRSCLQQRKSAPNSCFTIGRKAQTQLSQNIRLKNRQLVSSPLSYAPSAWLVKQKRTSLNPSGSQRPSKRPPACRHNGRARRGAVRPRAKRGSLRAAHPTLSIRSSASISRWQNSRADLPPVPPK